MYYFEEDGKKVEEQFTPPYNAADGTWNTGDPRDIDGLRADIAATPATQGSTLGSTTIETSLKSKAIFAQSTYTVMPDLDITAGVRYTDDSRRASRCCSVLDGSGTYGVDSLSFTSGSNSLEYDKTDWNLVAEYRVNDTVNVYAKAASGYRAGGSSERAMSFSDTFDEENMLSTELGVKAELMERRVRVNAAFFNNEYDDMIQTMSSNVPRFASVVEVFNLGEATFTGFELDVTALVAQNTTVGFYLSIIDTDLEGVVVPQESILKGPIYLDSDGNYSFTGPDADLIQESERGLDISDNTYFAYTPDSAYSLTLDHRIPLSGMSLLLHADYSWRDEVFTNSTEKSVNGIFQGLKVDELGLFNLRVTLDEIKVDKSEVSLSLWSKNVTDEEEIVYNLIGRGMQWNTPRTVGLDLNVKF